MIPHYLSLTNFLSYRETAEIDLRGLNLAAITGLNGAGKSTILDGMTWALFGKSRTKSDDDLVNRITGARGAAAEVVFIFELEGAIYRIIRRKAAGKTAELEFHARASGVGDGARWQVKTEARMRETQAEIEKLLRMNYDVFTNASFLLQGKADEFTTKTADRRKEILAEILGVSQWDAYKETATERRKGTEAEGTAIDRQLVEIAAELAQEDELSRALELAEAQAKAVTAERDRQDALVAVARQNKAAADQQREVLRRTADELAESERDLQHNRATTAQRRVELAGHQTLLDRQGDIEAAFAAWTAAEAELSGRQEKAERHNSISREMQPLEMAIGKAESALAQRCRELETQAERVTSATAERDGILSQLAEHQARRAQLEARAAVVADAERVWREARERLQELDYEHKLLEQECIQLQARARQIETWEQERGQFEESRRAASTLLESVKVSLSEMAGKRDELATKTAESVGLKAEQTRLRDEMDEFKSRIEQLKAEAGHDCPLCGQPLTEEHRGAVVAQWQAEGKERGERFRRNKAHIENLDAEVKVIETGLQGVATLESKRDSQQATVARMEARLADIDKNLAAWREGSEHIRLAEIEARLADGAKADALKSQIEVHKSAAEEARRLDQEQKQVDNLITRDQTRSEQLDDFLREWDQSGRPALDDARRRLAEKAYAEVERAALAEIQARLAAVGHDPAAHAAARDQLAELSAAPQDRQRLLVAEAAVKPLADGLADLERQRERLTTRAAELRTQREEAGGRLHELETGAGDLIAAEAELQRLREEVVSAIRAAGGARQKVEVLEVRRADHKKLSATKTGLANRARLLRQLEEACGRKGVQALLIEAALPEIEDYANELLYKLTNGEMSVSFETQRSSKSKQDSVIETLDIRISDGAGERPYENYSGGEKFRVNFAIRLALSQVLARRAGARLQTLVIDEGFGSQDPEGRQKLVEAINTVQSEFACILVITHIDELRDKFAARIDVEKTPTGSQLSVVTV